MTISVEKVQPIPCLKPRTLWVASSKVSAGFIRGLYTLRNVLVRNHRHIDPIFGANQMNRHAIHNARHSRQIYSHQQISMGDV